MRFETSNINITINEYSVQSRGSRSRTSSSGSRGLLNSTTNISVGGKQVPLQKAQACSTYSISSKIAKWTKKVQGSFISCGGTFDTGPSVEETTVPLREEDIIAKNAAMPNAGSILQRHARDMSTKYNLHKRLPDEYDHDHHTLATATTASATISYSTDQGDDASEVGMEVIMSRGKSGEGMEPTVTSTNGEPYRSHSFPAGKHMFTVDERYSMIRTIGSGAYGVVISAKDSKCDRNIAIKMVPKAFSDEIDAKRILREIKLLKHMRHENIVQLVDMMPPDVQYLEDYRDVYLVTDLMETDLHRIIYSKQKLSIDHVQYFVYQVLRGLKYIHSCRVIHRDLKPSNLLVNSNCDLKICDFGLARGLHEQNDEDRASTMFLTEYVVTRWYRAPEIMLACHEYSYPVDIWSVGCIFAELVLRKPYFPGDDYIDQVRFDLILRTPLYVYDSAPHTMLCS